MAYTAQFVNQSQVKRKSLEHKFSNFQIAQIISVDDHVVSAVYMSSPDSLSRKFGTSFGKSISWADGLNSFNVKPQMTTKTWGKPFHFIGEI